MILDELDKKILKKNFSRETIKQITYINISKIFDYLNKNGVYYCKDLFLSSLELFLLSYN